MGLGRHLNFWNILGRLSLAFVSSLALPPLVLSPSQHTSSFPNAPRAFKGFGLGFRDQGLGFWPGGFRSLRVMEKHSLLARVVLRLLGPDGLKLQASGAQA